MVTSCSVNQADGGRLQASVKRHLARWCLTFLLLAIVSAWIASGQYECGANIDDYHIGLEGGAVGLIAKGDRRTGCSHQTLGMWLYRVPVLKSHAGHVLVIVPLWCLASVVVIPMAALWYEEWRRKVRDRPGHCKRCGYNLSGNVSGRCPECGTEIAGSQRMHE